MIIFLDSTINDVTLFAFVLKSTVTPRILRNELRVKIPVKPVVYLLSKTPICGDSHFREHLIRSPRPVVVVISGFYQTPFNV